MSTCDQIHLVRCRLSTWMLATLSTFWTVISLLALRWLQAASGWSSLGPMEWLCLSLVAVHVALILATLWAWLHPRPEVLILGARRRTNRRFAWVFLVAFGAFWFVGVIAGWGSGLANAAA